MKLIRSIPIYFSRNFCEAISIINPTIFMREFTWSTYTVCHRIKQNKIYTYRLVVVIRSKCTTMWINLISKISVSAILFSSTSNTFHLHLTLITNYCFSDVDRWTLKIILLNLSTSLRFSVVGPSFTTCFHEPHSYQICILNTLRLRQNGCHFSDDIWNIFSWVNIYINLRFHLSVFQMVQFTIFQHYSSIGTNNGLSPEWRHCLTQLWLVHWRIYLSLSLNEITKDNLWVCFRL